MAGIYVGRSRGIPFIKRKAIWSIGIYTGDSPFNLSSPAHIKNPVLTTKDITDVPADFVADPFMLYEDNTWYMFFEVMNKNTKKGEIGLATSYDGLEWTYKKIVMNEPFHLSYPYVFKWENEYYMIPETGETNSVMLYKAVEFPAKWILSDILLEGHPFLDASIIHFNNRWWMFTSLPRNNILLLYYADRLTGPWEKHPRSPIILGDPGKARPGGRPIVFRGKIIRFTQDTHLHYGNKVRAFEITELTTTSYYEKEISENPVISATGSGWNGIAMHNIDPHEVGENKWIACVDGEGVYILFGIKY